MHLGDAMMMQIAKIAVCFSVLLSAPVAAPAFSTDKANCPYAKARQTQTKRIAAASPPRSIMIVEQRKRDVQILSFGP